VRVRPLPGSVTPDRLAETIAQHRSGATLAHPRRRASSGPHRASQLADAGRVDRLEPSPAERTRAGLLRRLGVVVGAFPMEGERGTNALRCTTMCCR
jgi:hypothetical protein